jgi:hypothetical protein
MPKTVSYSLPEFVIELVAVVRVARHDPSMSDTVRILLLRALADLGYLKQSELTALMFESESNLHKPPRQFHDQTQTAKTS